MDPFASRLFPAMTVISAAWSIASPSSYGRSFVFDLVEMDVDSDPNLVVQYGDRVPVVLNGREAISAKVTGEPQEAIKKARWRNPISRILSRVKLALTRG